LSIFACSYYYTLGCHQENMKIYKAYYKVGTKDPEIRIYSC
jgi:hypothetical protein